MIPFDFVFNSIYIYYIGRKESEKTFTTHTRFGYLFPSLPSFLCRFRSSSSLNEVSAMFVKRARDKKKRERKYFDSNTKNRKKREPTRKKEWSESSERKNGRMARVRERRI